MRAVACVFLLACGGDSDVVGEPLIQTTLSAEHENKPWTPMFGYARLEVRQNPQVPIFTLSVSADKISCADDLFNRRREVTYAYVGVDRAVVGSHPNRALSMVEVTDDAFVPSSVIGNLEITAVTETDISAVFSFDATRDGLRTALNGAATLVLCKP